MSENLLKIEAVDLLREMNISNQKNLLWWAFNFTSKNPLSSPLIKNLTLSLGERSAGKNINLYSVLSAKLIALLKLNFLYFEKKYYFKKKKKITPQIVIFSFLDGQKELTTDTYFGNLRARISNNYPSKSVGFIYLCYRPYFKFIKKLSNDNDAHLLSLLTLKDFIWIGWKLINLNINKYNIPKHIELTVKKVMIQEIRTTFIYNLSVYRAFYNINSNNNTLCVIYPFENKAIEKMLLMGVGNIIKSIGYQHSSVSLGHHNFILSDAEQKITPLPQKIITCGSVTIRFLNTYGKLALSKLRRGCELRNSFTLQKRTRFKKNGPYKILICFSSSYEEISNTIDILQSKFNNNDCLHITFRFHVNFPIEGLGKSEREWISKNVKVSRDTSLKEDLENTDVLGYITSSVSIIALKYGIPVIQLHQISPLGDPLFEEKIPNRFFLNENNIIQTIEKISTSKPGDIEMGINYASEYFSEPSDSLTKEFYNAH